MSRGKSNIVHDVKAAINEVDRIGKSKRALREKGEHGIHSLKQKQETLSASQNCVKWIRKEFGVKRLYELKEDHYRAYMRFLEREGTSVGHRRNVETALRHLQKGMDARSERFKRERVVWVPEKRVTSLKGIQKPKNRSYSDSEYQKILQHIPPKSRDAVMLTRELGLRIREAVRVEVQHFKPIEGGGWKLQINQGEGGGITKGGRYRETPVPKSFERELERMLHDKRRSEKLVSVQRDTVRRAVNEACRNIGISQNGRGMHGFRHSYSRARLDELLNEKGLYNEGRMMIERIMQNRDNGRLADYGIFNFKDKNMYELVKAAIDQVHSEIGHGKDRWDLAAVYMR